MRKIFYSTSKSDYAITAEGEVFNETNGRKLKLRLTDSNGLGYQSVHLLYIRPDGTRTTKRFAIHRLVASAFIPNPDRKPMVNHIDSDPSNNHVNNLEWVTAKENTAHAISMGVHKVPMYINGYKIIMHMKYHGYSDTAIVEITGVPMDKVSVCAVQRVQSR